MALQNQLRLRMRDEATRYYDGWVRSDDELNPTLTRNICLRSQVLCFASSDVLSSRYVAQHAHSLYTPGSLFQPDQSL